MIISFLPENVEVTEIEWVPSVKNIQELSSTPIFSDFLVCLVEEFLDDDKYDDKCLGGLFISYKKKWWKLPSALRYLGETYINKTINQDKATKIAEDIVKQTKLLVDAYLEIKKEHNSLKEACEHALTLGYLGEGSTRQWFLDVLSKK